MKECYLFRTIYSMLIVITTVFELVIKSIEVVIINVGFEC